ncbi:hypothetical protein GGR54DRAFT_612797 [Hypoxylon sp. NC1633]|nr:hypothetical protein GGR54DRAFT_612797 [Hypoxylon sp. NC1633]
MTTPLSPTPTVEELLRQVAQVTAQRDQFTAQRVQAEAQRVQAEAQRVQAEARADQAERLTRRTTLEEYLQACHQHVLTKISLITKGYLTSRTPITNPAKKHCPRILAAWDDFLRTQAHTIEDITSHSPRDARLFENIGGLEGLGKRVHGRPVRDEVSLLIIENNCVEDPVRIILSELKNSDWTHDSLSLPDGLNFQTPESNLRDETDGRDAAANRDSKLLTDQVCVIQNLDGRQQIAYFIQYKAPHKLHTTHFEQGLRQMSIVDEVVNKPTIPTDEPDKSKHYAELLSTAAVTQTYHYMLEAGLEYGYLTNGDAIVFLKIDWADPTKLFFHLAQPSREVVVNEDPIYSNAVCQVLAFTLLASQTSQHDNDERVAATKICGEWEVDFDSILDKITQDDKDEVDEAGLTTPKAKKRPRVLSSPGWEPKPIKKTKRGPKPQPGYGSDRVLRSHTKGGVPSKGGASGPSRGSGAPSGSTSQSHSSHTSDGRPTSTSSTHGNDSSSNRTGGTSRQCLPYCTPSCLLSLVRGSAPDKKCPNIILHMKTMAGGEERHPVSYEDLMKLLREQLSRSLVKGVVKLGQEGAYGALFQLTLLQYGYTFVAKVVTGRGVPMVRNEEVIYEKLQSLQGHHIPVCLGSVDLEPLGQVLFYDFDVRIIYFLLLSYGGTRLKVPSNPEEQVDIIKDVAGVLGQMHCLGVAHGDIRLPNILRDSAGQVVIVDFNKASVSPGVTPRKNRRRLAEEETSSMMVETPRKVNSYWAKARSDMGNAQSLFSLDMGRFL